MIRTARAAASAALLVPLVLAASCGTDAGAGGRTGSAALRIDSAEWRGGPEPRVVVSGEWSIGISTPPTCDLLEGEGGEPAGWYDRDAVVELDGDRFYKEFVPAPAAESRPAPDPRTEYYVRCRAGGLTGNSMEASAPVEGNVPAPR